LLTKRVIPLRHRAKVYEACIRSVRLYGSETRALPKNWKKLSYKVIAECFDIWQVYHYKIELLVRKY